MYKGPETFGGGVPWKKDPIYLNHSDRMLDTD